MDSLFKSLEDNEEGRDEEEEGKCSDEHAAYGSYAKRYIAVGASSSGEHHRK